MKLVAKFLVAFLIASSALLAVYAYLAAHREVAALQDSAESDMAALGDGLREGLIAVHAQGGEAAVNTFVRSLSARRSDVSVAWQGGAASGARGTSWRESPSGGRRVQLAIPVELPPDLQGTLSLTREIPGEGAVWRAQLVDQIAVSGGMVLATAVIAVLLGATLIGRPLGRVVAQARRIGAGDLSQRLRSTGTDEIGALKRELNAMCDRLVEARRRVDEEATARIETLEQLRHLDRLRTVGTLASSLAHELGTPLNVLLIRGQALADGEDDAVGAGQVIVAQVEKMSRIVRQILDFSRRRDSPAERLPLSAVARRAESLLRSLARKHGVAIEVRVVEDCEVLGNAESLEQAVTNLMINGVHAMPKGGALVLEVRVGDASPPGSSRRLRVGVIDVQDTGVGISEDQLSRVFEPFHTTKPAGVGTGLGLSVAAGIATDCGGWIDAKSAVGQGSSFAICIPRAE